MIAKLNKLIGLLVLFGLFLWLPNTAAGVRPIQAADSTPAEQGMVTNTCVTIAPVKNAGKDAYIDQNSPTSNKGGDSELHVFTESGKLKRSLIEFDLSGIPANSIIDSAGLNLFVKDVKDNSVTINAHMLTQAWDEATVTWNSPWTTTGGDYGPTIASTHLVQGVKDFYATWNVKTAVQEWISPSGDNYGLILEAPVSNPSNQTKFASNDESNAGKRPYLEVCYSPGLTLAPNNQAQTTAGVTQVYSHTLTIGALTNEVVNLSAASNQGWTVTIYHDVNGDGMLDPGDTPITQTPPLGPNVTYELLVAIDIPGATPPGIIDTTTLNAIGQNSGFSASVADITGVGIPPFTEPIIDGRIDEAYIYNPNSVVQDYCGANGDVLARTFTTYDINDPDYDNIYIVLEMDRSLVDNTYGTNIHPSWTAAGKSHSLGNLDGSDRAQFDLFDANGTLLYSPVVDYVESGQATPSSTCEGFPSGWGSCGITDGEGSAGGLDPAYFQGATSIEYDLNRFCSSPSSCVVGGTDLFTNSPVLTATQPTDPYIPANPIFNDWDFSYTYEIAIDPTAFGATGFGKVTIPFTHVSPNKLGNNELPVTKCTGSIGDRVWYDTNANGLQQSGEIGINSAQLVLYRDNGDGVFNATSDFPQASQTTSGDGDYDFVGLGPDKYFVDVVDGSIPSGYVLTTNNDPTAAINLGPNQDYNDADFGYYSPAAVMVEKTQVSNDPVPVGGEVVYNIRVTNSGPTVIDVLPLRDEYDTAYLSYNGATPPSDDNIDDGVINWSDLTTTFGNLNPGDFVDVTVRFTAVAPTNSAILNAHAGATEAGEVQAGVNTVIGGVNLGNLPNYLFFFANASQDANWQGATKGFIGDVAVDGLQASERTSGGVPYAGTIYTNDSTLDAWASIVDQNDPPQVNPAQAFGVTGQTSRVSNLEADLLAAFAQINALTPSAGYSSVSSTSLDGLNTQNGVAQTFVINITSDLNFSSKINITGDASDVFILRWDSDGTPGNGYQGQVKPQSGGAIVPLGGLKPSNFINVAGDINSSGGGSNPALPYPQGPRYNDGTGALIVNGSDFSGGGFFTGYWLTTGDPGNGDTSSLSNGIFVGGWYTTSDKFSMTSGTSGVYVSPNPATTPTKDYGDAPDTGAGTGVGNYNTLATDNGPNHIIVANLRLGNMAPDADNGTLQDATATADDANGSDDEDSVALLPNITSASTSVPLDVNVFNNTGANATVACWIDFNRDGDFLDTGERASTLVGSSVGQQTINLTFSGFAAPGEGASYLRCRLANTASEVANPTGNANTGEVEDYALTIETPPVTGITCDLAIVAGATDINGGIAPPVSDNACTTIEEPSVIGNYVWVDENADGYQDAGEPGLGSISVLLFDSNGDLIDTQVTDANGGYLFTGLLPGVYLVEVDSATLPAGAYQTTNPVNSGADFGNQSQPYSVSLGAGEENLTADFGYIWGNPNGNDDLGAIGDRVWIDSDGDGAQDPGEVGLGGIQVKIYYDSNGDGVVDPTTDALYPNAQDQNGALGGTTMTEPDGSYIFSNLPAGAYVVVVATPPAGYNQTGDPDDFGAPATAPDNRTTDPVVLAPGDVFLNADFGYQPTTQSNANNTLGDRVWFDNDADGIQDAAEKGIAGVTLSLLNSNGVSIATDTTDASGLYLFTGLPDGTYTIKVTDTDNVLAGLQQSGDPDAVFDGMSTVVDLGVGNPNPVVNLDQDFGYTPIGHDNGEGLIGDTIFLNLDGDNIQDPGEPGIEGVVVNLLDSTNTVVATTQTNENGNYYFGRLNPLAQYSVVVAASNFAPGGVLQGLNNTADPDGGNNSQSVVNLGAPGGDGNADEDGLDNGINLGQDFGYTPPAGQAGRIGNLIWRDANANGLYEAGLGETPIGGVTLDLYRDLNGDGLVDPNEPLIGATTSSPTIIPGTYGANGNYVFPGLPAGKYVVDVTDEAGLLAGYWHSLGAAGTDNNSQLDPYAVSIGNGNPLENLTADFGYYIEPAAIGDFVWNDLNRDGLQNNGEPGIAGVEVTLTITYPNGDVTVLTAHTGPNGLYQFNNLLTDEDYDGVGTPGVDEPRFVVTSETPGGLTPTLINQGANDAIDSDDPINGEQAEPKQGQTDNTNDFGFVNQILAAIGNYVWVDENADGYQDAGEPGLPNILVELYNDQAMLLGVAQTDTDGGYLFSDLAPGTYIVQVRATSLPSGLAQTTNPVNAGADFGNQSQPYLVTIGPGEENLTADFGYVWGNPNGNTGKGAIGDRIWIDANGDGAQDPGEPGLGGIQVTIYYDSNNDGQVQPGIDLPFPGAIDQNGNVDSSTLTEPDGSYIFYNLPAAQYVIVVTAPPVGYTQTGDPDDFGEPAMAPDNRTTTPIVLEPGDVFLNADFGYQPISAHSNTIGDTIYLDANGNGAQDFGEPGIPGVSVALLDNAGNILASDITDPNGLYLFTGLPDGTYTVQVTDTNNVLGELTQTGDPDGTLDEMSTVSVSGGVSNLDQDFGYAPPGHDAGEGLIGDTIFIDRNPNGLPDHGEGVEGVVVKLYDATGVTLLGTTVTNEDGLYYFGNLNPAGTYQVVVDTTTLLPGLFNSVDPDGGFDSRSLVDLSTTPDGVNLDQDFGYILPSHQPTDGLIGDTIFLDINHNNLPDVGEGLADVIVQLLDSSNTLIALATTDADGLYYFPGLPAGSYTVKVDTSTLPPGVTNTVDPDGGNNSQSAVTLGLGEIRLDQDFGYVPANPGSGTGTIGDTIYLDANGNSAPDAGEGLPGVVVYLYNSAGNLVGATTTNATGIYTFNNLPAGTYTVVVNTNTVPPALVNTVDPDGGNDSRSIVTIGNGNPLVNLDQDFGYAPSGHDAGEGLIGDTIFLDANGNGTPQAGEGLPGVTVRLYDGLGNPVAVTTTDDNGLYYFGGLPAGDYKVVVDTTTVPGGLVNSVDPDGGNDSQSMLTIGNGNPLVNLNQDFGYTPPGHNAGEGLIGDTIFLDANGNHAPDMGEGIGGVTVRLFNAANVLVATTVTDDNGLYYFGNLTAGTYKVVVDITTLPAGLTNTVDPDGVKDSQSQLTIGGLNPLVNLDQDFGYVPTTFSGNQFGAVGNQVWLDVNANGVYEPGNGEKGIAGVTLDLYWDMNGDGKVNPGEPVLGTQTTDSNGRYLFDHLSVDDNMHSPSTSVHYVVDVTDVNNALNNYWQSLGAAGLDNNSQTDPYGVMLTPAAPINLTADFGYYLDPAAVGDYVWFDEDKNGIQNTSPFEAPLPGAVLTLTITYPNGDVIKLVTHTNVQGKYLFGNLLLDEDYNGIGTPGVDEPTFIVTSKKPQIDYVPTPQDQGGNDNLDSDDPTGTQATPVEGQTDVKYDFGWIPGIVTAVSLSHIATLDGAAYGGLMLAGGLLLTGTLLVTRRRRHSAETIR